MSLSTAGMTLDGRYVLHRRIGDGGMGEVWQAHDRRMDRLVAIKLIPGAPESQIRQEAQSAARLVHPNIAGVYDFGDTGRSSEAYGYLVMELLSGPTLADRLAAGPLPWSEAAGIVADVARGLAFAHAHGVVHRDVKPANIMLTATGVKILDFGVAAATYRPHDPSVVAGTPDYAAPERLHGGPPDPASDVYGLAVVAYEMVTGDLPRPIHSWADLAAADFARPVPPPGGVETHAASVLAAALDPDPARRPTAAAMVTAFDPNTSATSWLPEIGTATGAAPVAPTQVTTRPNAGVASVPKSRPAPTSIAGPEVYPDNRLPRRILMIAAAVVVVLLATLTGYSALHKTGGPASGAAPGVSTSPTTAAPSVSATPTPASDVDALLATLTQTIQNADDQGRIDHGQAKDLSKRVDGIQRAWNQGDLRGFRDQCQQLRDAVNSGGGHGDNGGGDNGGGDNSGDHHGVDSALARTINGLIDQLLAAAGISG